MGRVVPITIWLKRKRRRGLQNWRDGLFSRSHVVQMGLVLLPAPPEPRGYCVRHSRRRNLPSSLVAKVIIDTTLDPDISP